MLHLLIKSQFNNNWLIKSLKIVYMHVGVHANVGVNSKGQRSWSFAAAPLFPRGQQMSLWV